MSSRIDSGFDSKTDDSFDRCQELLDAGAPIDSVMKEIREILIRVSFNGRIISKHLLQTLEDELEGVISDTQKKYKEVTGLVFQLGGAALQMVGAFFGAGAKTFMKGTSAAIGAGGQYLGMLQQAGLVPLQARSQAILSYLQIHQQSKANEEQQFGQAKAGLQEDERSRHEAFTVFTR